MQTTWSGRSRCLLLVWQQTGRGNQETDEPTAHLPATDVAVSGTIAELRRHLCPSLAFAPHRGKLQVMVRCGVHRVSFLFDSISEFR